MEHGDFSYIGIGCVDGAFTLRRPAVCDGSAFELEVVSQLRSPAK